MTTVDRAAGFNLLETGAVVEFQVAKTETYEDHDAAEFSVEQPLSGFRAEFHQTTNAGSTRTGNYLHPPGGP